METTFFIQAFAVLLFAGCFFHAWRTEGQRLAQQWFLIGYIYAILIISLLVVVSQIAYNVNMIVFGAAPSLTVMLFPGVFYVAYVAAKRFSEPTRLRATGYLIFTIIPWLMAPIDALGINAHWWFYPSESFSFLNGIPFYIPFAWGVTGAAFFLMFGRIRKIRFRGNGQFFAMIIAAPLLVGIVLVLIALIQVVVDTVAGLGGALVLYVALVILLGLFPLAVLLNVPRIRALHPATPARLRKK